MISKILFPVDFSPVSAAIAPYAKRAADMFGAQVTMVHVCDLASHNGFELYVRSLHEIAKEHLGIAQERLKSFLAKEFPGSERILRSGEAAQEIAETAKNGGFDLIVMPTHAGRFRRMLLGSTTAKVLNDAECPVMTTEHAEAAVPRSLEHRVWVCAIGLSDIRSVCWASRIHLRRPWAPSFRWSTRRQRMHRTKRSAGWRVCCKLWDARRRSR